MSCNNFGFPGSQESPDYVTERLAVESSEYSTLPLQVGGFQESATILSMPESHKMFNCMVHMVHIQTDLEGVVISV